MIPDVVEYFFRTGLRDLLYALDFFGVLLLLLRRRVDDLVELLLQIVEDILDLATCCLDLFVESNALLG